MIISRTPLRISFFGGGTDLPKFCNLEKGAVVSTSIDKYVYIVVHPSFDKKNFISYSKIEKTQNVDEIQNTRVREAMKMTGITKGVEIHSISEVPSGTGMGSSSSFTVGLLNALYAYQGKMVSQERLAREACEIELKILNESIGRQDQYIVAHGGFRKIDFRGSDVQVNLILIKPEIKKKIEERLLLVYLGGQRNASDILSDQENNLVNDKEIFNQHIKLRDLADEAHKRLGRGEWEFFGDHLHKNWMIKRGLSKGISDEFIDSVYERARNAGASGGKLLGAGGSGFLLLFVDPDKKQSVRIALKEFGELPIKLEDEGSKIIHFSN